MVTDRLVQAFNDARRAKQHHARFLAAGGSSCPACADTGTVAQAAYADGIMAGQVTRPMVCLSCGATWVENYRLAGYNRLVLESDRMVRATG